MKEQSIYSYYRFGYNYRIFTENITKKKVKNVTRRIADHLKERKKYSLPVTSQIIIEPLEEIMEKLSHIDEESIISEEIATELENLIKKADPALDSELQLKKVYLLTSKRFEVTVLLEDSKSLLAKDTWQKLTINAQNDFNFACQCIALNLGTSSAFHIMRAVEEMVKQLYFHYVKTNRLQKPMWGPMVEKLKNKKKPKPSQSLIDHLDNIRKNYRNPTQHPEKFYDIDEAQDLLHTSIVAINEISRQIGQS
ncbi:hypothetical protein LPTSP4_36690 [Leptospira ryugenii]|uniref:Uncharacterized protein n=1 Tax=Leptospira ryugenii TaxID=1917863 RepID=A0A2P2E5H3_9LEPT|nr:hypothetical protein [Leptospira ryugenii]GBF52131.1 hypothetical protein LPTSP4_36690 [Leptospira ryugenii]